MTADGMEVPAFMGTATAINFQPTAKGVAITGDFVMTASEVNPVIRELRKAGIQITALHSHMPRRNAETLFHALLGERRCGQARAWFEISARKD